MVNVASGASWVSFHDGGGVGIGYALHAGHVTLADGIDEGEKRIETILQPELFAMLMQATIRLFPDHFKRMNKFKFTKKQEYKN